MLPGQIYQPEDILRIAWRRRWIILVPFVAIAAGTFLFTRTLPNKYRSSTLILVVPQRVPERYISTTVTTRIEDRLVTLKQQTLSRSRLEPIINEFDLYREARKRLPMEDVVELMRQDIDPQPERGDAFSVSYVSEDPVVAKKVVERLASLFINENLRDRANQAENTNTFLDGALLEAQNSLTEIDKRLEVYRRSNAGRLPQNVEDNQRAIQSIEMQIAQMSDSVSRDYDRRRTLEQQIAELQNGSNDAVPSTVLQPAAPAPDSTAGQLEAAVQRLRSLQAKGYLDTHPSLKLAKQAVDDLTERLNAERSGASAPSRPGVPQGETPRARQLRLAQAELTQLNEQIGRKEGDTRRFREQLVSYQSKVDAAPGLESEYTALMRDYATKNSIYQDLLGKREASRLSADLERQQISEQFRVIDPARVPERPFSPNRNRINGLGALAGIGLGLGMVALLEYRDRSVKSAEDVVRLLQLPVLAMVPMMQSERELRARRQRRMLTAMAVGLCTVAAATTYVLWTLKVL